MNALGLNCFLLQTFQMSIHLHEKLCSDVPQAPCFPQFLTMTSCFSASQRNIFKKISFTTLYSWHHRHRCKNSFKPTFTINSSFCKPFSCHNCSPANDQLHYTLTPQFDAGVFNLFLSTSYPVLFMSAMCPLSLVTSGTKTQRKHFLQYIWKYYISTLPQPIIQ